MEAGVTPRRDHHSYSAGPPKKMAVAPLPAEVETPPQYTPLVTPWWFQVSVLVSSLCFKYSSSTNGTPISQCTVEQYQLGRCNPKNSSKHATSLSF